jgi:hydrogenase maturation protease
MKNDKVGGESTPQAAILILGVGNILMGDDGVGVRTVEAIMQIDLPDYVEVIDGGTASIDIQEFLRNRDKIIIIDAVRGGGERPGTVYRFTPGDIRVKKPVYTSLHQVGLLESLAILEYSGECPRSITIYGIEVEKPDWSLELSPEIAAVIPRLIEKILDDIKLKKE